MRNSSSPATQDFLAKLEAEKTESIAKGLESLSRQWCRLERECREHRRNGEHEKEAKLLDAMFELENDTQRLLMRCPPGRLIRRGVAK